MVLNITRTKSMSERLKKIFTKSRKIWVKDDTIYYDIVETPKEEAIENLKTILVEGNIYTCRGQSLGFLRLERTLAFEFEPARGSGTIFLVQMIDFK